MTTSPSYSVYHSALLDYVVGGGEPGLASAYELGRTGFNSGCGLLHMVLVHEKALNAILASTPVGDEFRRLIDVASKFLVEAMSPFEMACHGYHALLTTYQRQHPRSPLPRAEL
jgi:hypothetical protein